jgi:hypothetical protein
MPSRQEGFGQIEFESKSKWTGRNNTRKRDYLEGEKRYPEGGIILCKAMKKREWNGRGK